jgi:ribosome maturation factor RimP
MGVQEHIADLAAPAAAAAGLVVEDVKVSSAGKHTRVIVTVDLPETELGSASLDAIAAASHSIGAALDEANVPATEYILEVSTPGTDRPLIEPRHFMRARTRKVMLEMTDGTKRDGRLADVADGALVLDLNGETILVPLADVARGSVVVELKRLDPEKEGR